MHCEVAHSVKQPLSLGLIFQRTQSLHLLPYYFHFLTASDDLQFLKCSIFLLCPLVMSVGCECMFMCACVCVCEVMVSKSALGQCAYDPHVSYPHRILQQQT